MATVGDGASVSSDISKLKVTFQPGVTPSEYNIKDAAARSSIDTLNSTVNTLASKVDELHGVHLVSMVLPSSTSGSTSSWSRSVMTGGYAQIHNVGSSFLLGADHTIPPIIYPANKEQVLSYNNEVSETSSPQIDYSTMINDYNNFTETTISTYGTAGTLITFYSSSIPTSDILLYCIDFI